MSVSVKERKTVRNKFKKKTITACLKMDTDLYFLFIKSAGPEML